MMLLEDDKFYFCYINISSCPLVQVQNVNSLAPGGCGSSFQNHNVQTYDGEYLFMHLLWNCAQLSATERYWYEVNIGSGNGLVPSGNKLCVAIWHHLWPLVLTWFNFNPRMDK